MALSDLKSGRVTVSGALSHLEPVSNHDKANIFCWVSPHPDPETPHVHVSLPVHSTSILFTPWKCLVFCVHPPPVCCSSPLPYLCIIYAHWLCRRNWPVHKLTICWHKTSGRYTQPKSFSRASDSETERRFLVLNLRRAPQVNGTLSTDRTFCQSTAWGNRVPNSVVVTPFSGERKVWHTEQQYGKQWKCHWQLSVTSAYYIAIILWWKTFNCV